MRTDRQNDQQFSTVIGGVDCFSWRDTSAGVQNFGDEIGPLLIEAMLSPESRIRSTSSGDPQGTRLYSVGSVLHFAPEDSVVWGSGINGKVFRQKLARSLDVRAVRGPLTRAALLSQGIWVPPVFGDPALLLPDVFPELHADRGDDTIVVPNFNDLALFSDVEGVVSPLGDPMEIIRRIASAKFVIASSLHALIVADAFGVPNRGIASQHEHPFKYIDYYAGTGRAATVLANDIAHAHALGPVSPLDLDLTPLREAFPRDLWGDRGPDADSSPRPASYVDFRNASRAQRVQVAEAIGWEAPSAQSKALVRLDQLCARVATDGITREEAAALNIPLAHMNSVSTHEGLLLSVVVPTHNVAPWIAETLASLRAQDVEGMEIIVVDDHSTDGTKQILRAVERDEPRLKVIDSVTYGGGSARNIGVDHARGKYLIFCDGDDLVPPGAYCALVQSLEESGSDIAFGDYLKFSPTDTWRPTASMSGFQQRARGVPITERATLIYSRPCWNKAFSRGFWESRKIRFPDVPRSNDIVPMTKAYLLARKVDVIDDVVYLYRERPGTSSMTSRASSAVSTVSYFTQEAECAQLIIGTHSPSVDRVYAALVYDRDGYVHLTKYLKTWEAPSDADSDVVESIRRVTRMVKVAGSWLDPLKRLTFALVADGEIGAAAALTAVLTNKANEHGRAVPRTRQLVTLLDALTAKEYAMTESARRELAERVLLELAASAEDDADSSDWSDAAARATDFFAFDVVRAVPEFYSLRNGVRPSSESVRMTRSSVSGRVTALRGGKQLVLEGTSLEGAEQVVPVLFEPLAEDHLIVRPVNVDWREDGAVFHWRAQYTIDSLPLHRSVVPAMQRRAAGLVSITFDSELPEYEAQDAFLYRTVGSTVVIDRRRHWVLRAGRRGLIIARDRAGATLRRLRRA